MSAFVGPKDPDDISEFGFNWTEWLEGDTIATSTWVTPAGLTYASDANTTTTTNVFVTGGTEGTVYKLVNRIVTAAGRQADRTIRVRVYER